MINLKFWQRIYLAVLFLLLLAVTIIICIIGYNSHQQYANAVINQAKVAHAELEKTVSFEVYKKQQVSALSHQEISYKSFEKYYSTKTQFLMINENNQTKVSTFDKQYTDLIKKTIKNNQEVNFITIDTTKYIVITKPVSINYSDLVITYIQDFSDVEAAWNQQLILSLGIGITVSIILLIGLYFVIKKFTKPLDTINHATNQFALGMYDTRLSIKQKDEFGDLANSFNNMAMIIEKNIHQLEEVSIQKQELVNNIAHEIRTPLTNIQGYGELLLNAKIDEDKRYEMMTVIIEESKKLQKLSSKMLELGYLQKQDIDCDDVNIANVIEKSIRDVMKKSESKHIVIEMHGNKALKIKGDTTLLQSMFTNLLDNALNSMDKPGQIKINMIKKDTACCIEIQDQGIGMTEEQVEQLGNPFYRIDKSRSRKLGGHGLGVSLCKQIIEAHGGTITYVTKLNEGTKVVIVFTIL